MLRRQLEGSEAELQRLLDIGAPDDGAAIARIEEVERRRAHVNIARTRMLLRVRRLLTRRQRTELARFASADRR
jgi:Spy/CpxP family protein refolding chaperone